MLGVKDNQPTLHQLAQNCLSAAVPDEWVSEWEKDHGRVERRHLARVDLDWDISLFPGARQLIRSTREWIEAKSDECKSETRYFITSLEREEKSAALLAQAIRGHWSVENKNHWKRDTSLWKEDASRPRKKASGGQVLALLRGAILRLHDLEAFASLNAGFHHHSAKPWLALRLLKNPPPQIN
ncbi:ISAs1 family transposase [Haloferula sp.]|uniref:ISAs1 family transposase n=1 Tax=Haloferula sp. TaxID=2497595 RepID=UPI003C708334